MLAVEVVQVILEERLLEQVDLVAVVVE